MHDREAENPTKPMIPATIIVDKPSTTTARNPDKQAIPAV